MTPRMRESSGDGETYRPAWEGSKTSISFGLPYIDACCKHVATTFFKSYRIYIIASGSLSRNTDCVRRLRDALGSKVVGVRTGMRPHTLWSEVLEVAREAGELHSDLLITLGAGSLTDAAKIVALAMANEAKTFQDLDKLHSSASPLESPLTPPQVPIVCIPTSLSGGEYNANGGGTNDHDHRKYSFAGPSNPPALVILDPELTTTTPERWWLSTGVRAVDHCVEAICSLKATAQSDADASAGLKLLVPGLLRCKKDDRDLEARLQCQMGVIESLKAVNLGKVPMGASHAIGHQLGPLNVGHGETSCILLPAVCKFNHIVNAEKQDVVRKVLWEEAEVRKVLEGAGLSGSADLGDMLDAAFRFLGMPRTLKEFDIGSDKLDLLAENSLHDRWIGTNPRPLTKKNDVMEILKMVKG